MRCVSVTSLFLVLSSVFLPLAYGQGSVLQSPTAQAGNTTGLSLQLVRAQAIPMTRDMPFEQAIPEELIDQLSLLTLSAMKETTQWHPKMPKWQQYRINIRNDVETKLRQRWQTQASALLSNSASPGALLADLYASQMNEQELAQSLEFYQSLVGRKFITYQLAIRKIWHRGQTFWQQELLRARSDGATESDALLLQALQERWLVAQGWQANRLPAAYGLPFQSLRRFFAQLNHKDLLLPLVAALPLNSSTWKRIDDILSADEKRQVAVYWASPAGVKELEQILQWHSSLNPKQLAELPMFAIGQLDANQEWAVNWRNLQRLPQHQTPPNPSSTKIPVELIPMTQPELQRLDGSWLDHYKACLPDSSESAVQSLEQFIRSKDYLRNSRASSKFGASNLYVTRNEWAACIPMSPSGFPILSPQALANTIRITGLQTDQERSLERQIVLDVANHAASSVIVIGPNGNGQEINFALDVLTPIRLTYFARFLPPGSFVPTDYSLVLQAPQMKSISVSASIGNAGPVRMKSIVSTPIEIQRDQQSRLQER